MIFEIYSLIHTYNEAFMKRIFLTLAILIFGSSVFSQTVGVESSGMRTGIVITSLSTVDDEANAMAIQSVPGEQFQAQQR